MRNRFGIWKKVAQEEYRVQPAELWVVDVNILVDSEDCGGTQARLGRKLEKKVDRFV